MPFFQQHSVTLPARHGSNKSFWHYYHNMCIYSAFMHKKQCIWLSASSQLEVPLQRSRGAKSLLPPESAWIFRSFRSFCLKTMSPLKRSSLSNMTLIICSKGVLSSDFGIRSQHGLNATGHDHSALACVAAQLRVTMVLQNWKDGQSFKS